MINNISIKIGNRIISEKSPTFIIAEIGSNHNRNIKLAKKIIKEISRTGADAVKFQTFRADYLVNKRKRFNAYNLLKANELPFEWHEELKVYTESNGLIFMSTPFDFDALELLKELDVSAYKIASGDITYLPLIERIAKTGKPLIISVGAASGQLIRKAVDAVRGKGNNKICLCQCIVNYPTQYQDANIKVLDYLKEEFGVLVGYSDHSKDSLIPVLAVARGAVVIEKHVTLDNTMKGPDHKHSLEIDEFHNMVHNIRKTEVLLGAGRKEILDCEKMPAYTSRRSIYAKENLAKGDKLSERNLIILRPKIGLNPCHYDFIIGQRIKKKKNILDPIYKELK